MLFIVSFKMKLYLVALVCGMCLVAFSCGQDYLVINEDIEHIDGQTQTLVHFNRVKTINRGKINGSWEISEDMDNENFQLSVVMSASSRGDGDFKRLSMGVPTVPVCEGFQKFYVQFIEPGLIFNENSNFPFIGNSKLCPIPAGTYYLKEILFNTKNWPNKVPYGIIRCVITFYKNKVSVGGVTITVNISKKE